MKKELNVVTIINELEAAKENGTFEETYEVFNKLAMMNYITSDEYAIITKYFK